jgi:hypothetical protein
MGEKKEEEEQDEEKDEEEEGRRKRRRKQGRMRDQKCQLFNSHYHIEVFSV